MKKRTNGQSLSPNESDISLHVNQHNLRDFSLDRSFSNNHLNSPHESRPHHINALEIENFEHQSSPRTPHKHHRNHTHHHHSSGAKHHSSPKSQTNHRHHHKDQDLSPNQRSQFGYSSDRITEPSPHHNHHQQHHPTRSYQSPNAHKIPESIQDSVQDSRLPKTKQDKPHRTKQNYVG